MYLHFEPGHDYQLEAIEAERDNFRRQIGILLLVHVDHSQWNIQTIVEKPVAACRQFIGVSGILRVESFLGSFPLLFGNGNLLQQAFLTPLGSF